MRSDSTPPPCLDSTLTVPPCPSCFFADQLGCLYGNTMTCVCVCVLTHSTNPPLLPPLSPSSPRPSVQSDTIPPSMERSAVCPMNEERWSVCVCVACHSVYISPECLFSSWMNFFHGITEEKGKVLKGVQNQLKVQISDVQVLASIDRYWCAIMNSCRFRGPGRITFQATAHLRHLIKKKKPLFLPGNYFFCKPAYRSAHQEAVFQPLHPNLHFSLSLMFDLLHVCFRVFLLLNQRGKKALRFTLVHLIQLQFSC